MIQTERKAPKKPVKPSLEKQVSDQKAQIEYLQNAIDDLILAQMNLEGEI